MPKIYSLGKESIQLNDEYLLEIEEKTDGGYKWKEVNLKSESDNINIGFFYTYNYSCSREWMRYNSRYIAILATYNIGYDYTDPYVKVLFDIENKQFVKASDDELMDIYVESFKGVSKKKTKKISKR